MFCIHIALAACSDGFVAVLKMEASGEVKKKSPWRWSERLLWVRLHLCSHASADEQVGRFWGQGYEWIRTSRWRWAWKSISVALNSFFCLSSFISSLYSFHSEYIQFFPHLLWFYFFFERNDASITMQAQKTQISAWLTLRGRSNLSLRVYNIYHPSTRAFKNPDRATWCISLMTTEEDE